MPSGDSNCSTTVTSLSAPASMITRGKHATPASAIRWVMTIGSVIERPAGTVMTTASMNALLSSWNTSIASSVRNRAPSSPPTTTFAPSTVSTVVTA